MHLRGPCGVSMVAAYLPAIFDTDESYLPANVLSIEVSITECSRLNRQNVAGEQVVLNDPPILGPVAADDRVILLVHQLGPSLGFSEAPGMIVGDSEVLTGSGFAVGR
jgi:hypothetical protein